MGESEDKILELLRELKGILIEHGLKPLEADKVTGIFYDLLQERWAQICDYVKEVLIPDEMGQATRALIRHEHSETGEAIISLRDHLDKRRP